MDSVIEKWMQKRKPFFARSGDDIIPKISNALSDDFEESHQDRVPYFLRSNLSSAKDSSVQKVKGYNSFSKLSERNILDHHENFHVFDKIHSRKEDAANSLHSIRSAYKELPEQEQAPTSMVKKKSEIPQISFQRPAMFRKEIDPDYLKMMVERAKARRAAEANLKNHDLVRTATRGSSRKDLGIARQNSRPELFNSISKQYNQENISDLENNPSSSKECCRALCFDSCEESQENEDLTVPLDMMDMTALLVDSKPIGLGFPQPPEQRNYQPPTTRSNKIQRSDSSIGKEKFNVKSSNETNPSFSSQILQPKINVFQSEVKVKKINVGKENVVKRRSVIPLSRNFQNSKVKDKPSYGVSKLAKFSDSKCSQIRSAKKTQKVGPKSIIRKPRKSQKFEIPKVVVTVPPQPEISKKEHKKKGDSPNFDVPKVGVAPSESEIIEEKHKPIELCHAPTNTGILFSLGKSPDKNLIKEVETLMVEQEEITRKASLISDETTERRKRMKSAKLFEGFKTSVSPVKRLYGIIQDISSVLKSAQEIEADTSTSAPCHNNSTCFDNSNMEISGVENISHNESLNCSILNDTGDFNSRHHKWKRLKLNSRSLQNPSDISKNSEKISDPVIEEQEEEEHFSEVEKDISPFTEMAGCCERPSLAPMTPHSHHQVSMIKLSLRKQLSQLYDS